jgi:hypothetical protein
MGLAWRIANPYCLDQSPSQVDAATGVWPVAYDEPVPTGSVSSGKSLRPSFLSVAPSDHIA